MKSGANNEIALSPLYRAFMGFTTEDDTFSNDPEGYARAFMASVWVGAPIRVRAKTLAGIQLKFLDINDRPLPRNHPLVKALSTKNSKFLRTLESQLCIFGQGFVVAYFKNNELTLQTRNPMTMKVHKDLHGIKGYTQEIGGRVVERLDKDQVIFIYDFNPTDDLGGLSPMQYALLTVGLDVAMEQFSKVYFENYATPAGLLTFETYLDDAQTEEISSTWKKLFMGIKNRFKVGVLGKGAKFQAITPDLVDLAMKDLDDKTKKRLAATWGVPSTIAFMDEAANYATAVEQRRSFYTETVIPELDLILNALNDQLCPLFGQGIHIEIDMDSIDALQEERAKKSTRLDAMYAGASISVNERREADGLPPLKTDFFIINGAPVSRSDLEAGKFPEATVAAASPPSPFSFRSSLKSGDETLKKALAAAINQELSQWKHKVTRRGIEVKFDLHFIPPVQAMLIKMDLRSGMSPQDVFDRAKGSIQQWEIKADGEDPGDPDGIWKKLPAIYDDLYDAITNGMSKVGSTLVNALSNSAGIDQIEQIVGEEISTLVDSIQLAARASVIAGVEKGEEILANFLPIGTPRIGVSWDVLLKEAEAWADQFAAQQMSYITQTNRDVLRQTIGDWTQSGGTLPDLAKEIQGKLDPSLAPPGVSAEKLKWMTSRERANLIAQTESTSAFTEGSFLRWAGAGVNEFEWQTNFDTIVCETCESLDGKRGQIGIGVPLNGKYYTPPAHPGCRCFPAPVVSGVQ